MIVLFGSTGDLAKRKLIPAILRLLERDELDASTPVVCLGRTEFTQEQYLVHLEIGKFVRENTPGSLDRLRKSIIYTVFDLGSGSPESLHKLLTGICAEKGCTTDMLFYFALPTRFFARAAELIRPLLGEPGWKRVVFEKPFGEDLLTAEDLNRDIMTVLSEEQIFRVDHYLGKELVQNILFLRFANEIFSCSWSSQAIDNVQISVCESIGVEERSGYYDSAGAVRDMLQNHLLQLLTLVAMEPPETGKGNAVRDEAAVVLANLRLPQEQDVVLGQYTRGEAGGKKVAGYSEEAGIRADSDTETYVALRAYVDTPRWKGVPFYLRTGKRLTRRYAEITIVLKQTALKDLARLGRSNMITVRIQPDEGIALAINVRKPGNSGSMESVLMDFCHHCHFGPNTPEAYETILSNVLRGDPLLFTRWDWLRASWRYIDRLREVAPEIVRYRAGSEGPEEASALLRADGRAWVEHRESGDRGLKVLQIGR